MSFVSPTASTQEKNTQTNNCSSYIPRSPSQLFGQRTGRTSSQDPHISCGAQEGRDRQARRLRVGHACPSSIQILVFRSLECHKGSLLDLFAPPQRRAATQAPWQCWLRHQHAFRSRSICRARAHPCSNVHTPPLPRPSASCPCCAIYRWRRMGRNHLPCRTP